MSRTTRATRRPLSFAAPLLFAAFTVLVPAASQADCGPANPWFQPSTVEKGYEFLVTGTGVGPGTFLIFTFVHQTAYPTIVKRYMTGIGNDNCVVNQEYVDTSNFKKGDWTVIAETYNSQGVGSSYFLNPLSIVPATTTAPIYPVSCGQTAHPWFGPATVGQYQQMYIAAVARPYTRVDFYFEPPNFHPAMRVLSINAGGNCVANQYNFFPAQQLIGPGTWNVSAGFWDENGEYHYNNLGTLTVTP